MLKQANVATAKTFIHAEEKNRDTTDRFYSFALAEFPKRRLLRAAKESEPTRAHAENKTSSV
jgi:hypothetical protein